MFKEEERDGKKVVVVDSEVFKKSFKPKKMSKKHRMLIDNGVEIKYLPFIKSSKGKYSFKV